MKLDRRRLLLMAGSLAVLAGLPGTGQALASPDALGNPFTLGVASGDPSPDGFVIWTRLAPRPLETGGGMPSAPVMVSWEVAKDEQFRIIAQAGQAIARPELAHSVHVEVTGLEPYRPYWYRFTLGTAARSIVGRVRTAPAAGVLPERIRIGIAGCQSLPQGWYEAWRHMSEEPELDAVFHYGDYIYENDSYSSFEIRDASGQTTDRRHIGGETYSLEDYRRRYAQYKEDPNLQVAHAAVAFIVSFDDHEIDNNWADVYDQDGTPPEIFALRRFAAMQAWYEHMPVRRAQFPHPAGLTMFRRLDFGHLFRMHVLDTRSYRSDQLCRKPEEVFCRREDDPSETLLGAEQEAWLSAGLDNSARWNILAQQVRVMPLRRRSPDGAFLPEPEDTWGGYPAARARLVNAISDRQLTNVVIASGDAHMHMVGAIPLRTDDPGGQAVATEFLSSSISSGGDGAPLTPVIQAYLDGANPNLALANHQRGYQMFDITPDALTADVKVLDQVQAPGGRISSIGCFEVTPDKPGVRRTS